MLVEPLAVFAETPGPGKEWWEGALSEKSFRSEKPWNSQQNQGVGAKSRTTHLSPFGELIRTTGPLAHANPFRFSTKFYDEESGLVYYGYRFYSPGLGRWISRDPTTDQLMLNLYLFCHNNSVWRVDTDGRGDLISLMGSLGTSAVVQGLTAASINGVIALVKKQFLNEGTWKDVLKSSAEGFAIGFFMGPLGKLSSSLQEAMGLGKGMVGTEVAGGVLKGIRGAISMVGGAGINSTLFGDDRAIQQLIKNPSAQLGIGVGVGLIAGMVQSGVMESGAWAGGTSADDIILTFAVDAAGKLGVMAAENIWGVGTQVSDQWF